MFGQLSATRGRNELYDGVNQLRALMDRMLESGWMDEPGGQQLSFFEGTWPPISVVDEGARLVVTAQLPGLARQDISLALADDVLTLRGCRDNQLPEGYSALRREREAAQFTRSISLPSHVDPERVAADLKNGVLTVTLDKADHAKPRQIAIASAS